MDSVLLLTALVNIAASCKTWDPETQSRQPSLFIHPTSFDVSFSLSYLPSYMWTIEYFQDDGPLSRRLGARISPYIILLILRKCCLHMDQEFMFLIFKQSNIKCVCGIVPSHTALKTAPRLLRCRCPSDDLLNIKYNQTFMSLIWIS